MASTVNKYLAKAVNMTRRVSGKDAAVWTNRAQVMKDVTEKNISPLRIKRMAYTTPIRRSQARAKLGLGAVATVTTGFLGAHKYHQHKDSEIMKRIDNMYKHD